MLGKNQKSRCDNIFDKKKSKDFYQTQALVHLQYKIIQTFGAIAATFDIIALQIVLLNIISKTYFDFSY